MKKTRVLLLPLFTCFIIFWSGCNLTNQTVQLPATLAITAPSPITSASPAPSTATSTSVPSPTNTPHPFPTPRLIPSDTSIPFLPANLSIISPQNSSRLELLTALPDQGASVVAYSPDSRRIAAGFFRSNQIKAWDLDNGQALFTLNGQNSSRIISYLAFSPDGSILASAAQGWDAPDDSLILWEAGSGFELQRFNGVLGAVSPDWRTVALTQREQKQGATLIISDLETGVVLHSLKAPGDIYDVIFSPDGKHVAAKMYNVIQDLFSFWSVESGYLERTQYNWVDFSYSPDGRFIAALVDTGSGSDKGELNIYDAATFKWIKTLAKDADSLWYTFPVFSPDGKIVAASFSDHIVLWETQSWMKLASLKSDGPAGFSFSPDKRILTTYTYKGPVQLWGVTGGQ